MHTVAVAIARLLVRPLVVCRGLRNGADQGGPIGVASALLHAVRDSKWRQAKQDTAEAF